MTSAQLIAHDLPRTTQKGIVLQAVINDSNADIAEIAKVLKMQTGTVSARVNDLQRDGYITALEISTKTTYRYEPNKIKRLTHARKFYERNHPITKFYNKYKEVMPESLEDELRSFYRLVEGSKNNNTSS